MPILLAKRYLRRFGQDLRQTRHYLQLALSGNKVERLTDFARCKHPVLLLYGFGATRGVFSLLERRLRRDGFCVFSLRLGGILDTYNTRSIEELADHVKKKVERICRRYRLKKIHIIGHSKGGLIGHYYVKKLGGARRAKSLITLGTPHEGNPWVILGLATPLALISKSLWQMVPMSPFIRRLKKGNFPKACHFVSIYSKDDRICYYKSAMLDVPKRQKHIKNVEIRGIGHAGLVTGLKAYQAIRRELRAGERRS